jgi:hypothetical protein
MPMHPRLFPRRRLAIIALASGALLGLATPALAAPRVLVVDGNQVRSEPANGAELAGADAAPSATAGLAASAARATSKPKAKTKAKKPPYDLKVIRKRINALGGAPDRKYAARAALTGVYLQMAKTPKGQAKTELENILKITTVMARGNRITTGRLPMLTETLSRNTQWWKLRKATGSGQRIQPDGSNLIWQYYPGSGMQLQWLGTFGRGNALAAGGAAVNPQLAGLVDEATRFAVPRAGGISWEYFFPFGGGSPPWVSGMAEATGIQVFSRASTKLLRPDLLATAKTAMTVLKTAPTVGTKVVTDTGTIFLLYSFDKGQIVLNAQNQTVNGLYAYVHAAPDDVDARLLLLDGLRWLDSNIARYDTGSWSLYSLGGAQATTSYHALETEFLKTLCGLLKSDAAAAGGGPTGAYPSANICKQYATWDRYLKARV